MSADFRDEELIHSARMMDIAGVRPDASPDAVAAVALVLRRVKDQEDRLQRVRRLHRTDPHGPWCAHDGQDYPCATRRMADGETA